MSEIEDQILVRRVKASIGNHLDENPPPPLRGFDRYVVEDHSSRTRSLRRWLAAAATVGVIAAGLMALYTNSPSETIDAAVDVTADAAANMPAIEYPTVEPVRGPLPSFKDDDLMRETAERGWMPATEPGEEPMAFMSVSSWWNSNAGDVNEAIDVHGNVVGYRINGIGYVDRSTFADPAFDWRAEVRRSQEDPQVAELIIWQAEDAHGGLSEPQPAVAEPDSTD